MSNKENKTKSLWEIVLRIITLLCLTGIYLQILNRINYYHHFRGLLPRPGLQPVIYGAWENWIDIPSLLIFFMLIYTLLPIKTFGVKLTLSIGYMILSLMLL